MNFLDKTVSIIGQGYVGFPCALLISNAGIKTFGYDLDKQKIEKIQSSISPIDENDIQLLLDKNNNKNYFATNKLHASDIYIICVPTPEKDDKPDLTYVMQAAESICQYLKKNDIVIIESTSPVGTTHLVSDLIAKERPEFFFEDNIDLVLAYCPERVLPGDSVRELQENPRIIGGLNKDDAEIVASFYKFFLNCEVHTTNAKTAELSKLAENAYRDVNIALANELSMICDQYKISTNELIDLASQHPRVNILSPGIGVGGHCIPIDPKFLDIPPFIDNSVFKSARYINDFKEDYITKKILRLIESNFHESDNGRLIIYGLSYKENSNDLRSSPAMRIATSITSACQHIDIVINNPNNEQLPKENPISKLFVGGIINPEVGDKIILLVKHKILLELIEMNADKLIFAP